MRRATLLLVLVLTACSQSSQTAVPSPGSPSKAPTATPSTGASPAQASSETITAVSYKDVSQEVDRDGGAIQFVTPTKNIGCVLVSGGGTCFLVEQTWTAPPRPANCEGDYTPQAIWFSEEAGVGGCGGSDTPYDANAMVLEYGTGLAARDVRCSSARAGLTCENTRTKHGFTVSRSNYRLF